MESSHPKHGAKKMGLDYDQEQKNILGHVDAAGVAKNEG